jgi:hypothetical protein
MVAAEALRFGAEKNDLLDRLEGDPLFAPVRAQIHALTKPARFVGLAPQQVAQFVKGEIEPFRKKYASELGAVAELRV